LYTRYNPLPFFESVMRLPDSSDAAIKIFLLRFEERYY